MSTVRTVLLVALLALPLVAAQTNPNPRSPDLSPGSAITAFDLARSATWVAAGRADPGGGVGTSDPNANVWNVWNEAGDAVRTGAADASANCIALTDPGNCKADVIAIALSASGTRIAIAAQDNGKQTGRLLFATTDQGIITASTQSFSNEVVTSLAMSPDGSRIALGSSVPNGVNPAKGMVRLYSWSAGSGANPGSVATVWATATDEAVTRVALGESGTSTQVAAAATGLHYRFKTSGAAVKNDLPGNAVAVAFAESSTDKWSVVGSSDGTLQIYSKDSEASPFAPALDLRPDTAAEQAVAIAKAGNFFLAGDAAGKLRLYRNPSVTGLAAGPVVTTPALAGAVADIALSADDRYLAVAAGKTVALYRSGQERLDPLWTSTLANTVTAVGISEDGGVVAAASGTGVTVFTTLRSVSVTPPAAPLVQPGKTSNVTLQVANLGNREESPTFEGSFPADWTGSVSPAFLTLLPGATGAVTLRVTPPAAQPAGAAQAQVITRLGGIPSTTNVPLTVDQQHLWTLLTDDATNQAIQPGASVRFTLDLKNLGNGQDTTQIVASVDDSSWTVTVQPASFTLAAGASGTTVLTLTAPAGAHQLDSAHATVRLSADSSAALRLGATVGGRFGLSVAPPAAVQVRPGQSEVIQLQVTNTGNTVDSYTVQATGLPAGWTLAFPGDLARIEVLGSGASTGFPVTVSVPADAGAGTRTVTFQITSLGDANQRATVPVSIVVLGAANPSGNAPTTSEGKGSPGLPLVLVLAAIGVAGLLATRKR